MAARHLNILSQHARWTAPPNLEARNRVPGLQLLFVPFRISIMTKHFSPDQSAAIVDSAVWTMLMVATSFLALRVYCRAVRARQLWWDDYILTVGWMFMVVASSILTRMMHDGYADTVMTGTKMMLLTRMAHTSHMVSLSLTKISFAVTLLRLIKGWQRHIVWFVIVSISLAYTVHIILLWRAMCGVEADNVLPASCWGPKYPIYMNVITSCTYQTPFQMSHGSSNSIVVYSGMTDLVLAILPWRVIMDLQMKKSERIGVALAMSMGMV